MKNFSKKLSFVMATAMVVTSLYAPQNAAAAAKSKLVDSKTGKTVTRNIYLGGQTVDLNAVVKGKKVSDSKGTWKSSNKKVATVDKNGVVKALMNGDATISFKTKGKKSTTVKKVISVRTRASKVMVSPASVMVKESETAEVKASYELSEKVKAAGGKETTYKLFAKSSDEKVATVTADGDTIKVTGVAKSATPATITVYAAQADTLAKAEKLKVKVATEFAVKVNGSLEAKQSGANKIKVMGTNLVASSAAYVIKSKAGAPLKLADKVEVNEAGTEATLYGDTTYLPAGEYTLSYQGGEPVEFTTAREVVKSITLDPTDKAVLVSSKEAVAYYKVLNQFEEDITEKFSSSNVIVAGSDNARKGTEPGTIEFNTTVGYQLGLSKVSVSIVDTATGVHTEGILTVSEESKIVEAKFEGIYNKSTRKFVKNIDDVEDKTSIKNYYLVFSGKDQYGHTVTQTDSYTRKSEHTRQLVGRQLNIVLLSGTGLTNEATGQVDTINGHKYITYRLEIGSSMNDGVRSLRAGEVQLQAIAINSGKSISDKFNVESGTKVDTLTIRESALGVYDGQVNELEFEALDQNGKPIKDWKILKNLNTHFYNRNAGDVRFEKKEDGSVGLFFESLNNVPDQTKVGTIKVISFVTETNKFVNQQITIKPDRYPAAIIGLKKDFATGVTRGTAKNDHSIVVKAQDFRYQDQYGNEMDANLIFKKYPGEYAMQLTEVGPKSANYFVVDKAAVSGAATTVKKDNVFLAVKTVISSAISNESGEGRYKFRLTGPKHDDNNNNTVKSDYEFSLFNVRLQDMSGFAFDGDSLKLREVADPFEQSWPDLGSPVVNLKNVAGKDETHPTFEAKLYGMYAGDKVNLVKEDDFIAFASEASLRKAYEDKDSVVINVPNVLSLGNDVERDAGIRAIVKNGLGTEINNKYKYSKALRVVKSAGFTDLYGDHDRTVKATPISGGAAVIDWDVLQKYIKVEDQYGNPIAMKPYITFEDFTIDPSNLNKGTDGQYATITHNGEKDAKFTFKEGQGTSIQNGKQVVTLKLTFPRSGYEFKTSVRLGR